MGKAESLKESEFRLSSIAAHRTPSLPPTSTTERPAVPEALASRRASKRCQLEVSLDE